jgi:hypothetical protein
MSTSGYRVICVIILFHGLPKGKLLFLDPQLKRSICWWLILWLKWFGYVNFLSSCYIDQLCVLLSSVVTTFQQFTWRPIQYNIAESNTLSLTFILFREKVALGKIRVLHVPTSVPTSAQFVVYSYQGASDCILH